MNWKKLGMCVGAVFVTIWVTDFLIHGIFMKATYQATQQLWRPEAEMGKYMPAMMGGQLLIALFFSWIFAHGYKGTGLKEGIRYGLLIGGMETGKNMIMYSVAPYECSMTAAWIGFGFLQAVIAGVVASLVYK